MIKALIKYTAFGSLIAAFLAHHTLITFIVRNEEKRHRYFLKSIQITSKLALKVLNVKITRHGIRGEVSQRLIVANHLSYLDVLVLFTEFPALFVTSTEIRDTFLLGDICKMAGCFFVERRRDKRSVDTKNQELNSMKQKFANGFNVFLFPEGTSSDGRQVLPFKGTFFQLAIDTHTPVVPVVLKYNGENRDVPPWYGDMTFPDHLFRLCNEKELKVSVTVLPEVMEEEKMKFAKTCYEHISHAYA